MNTDRQRTWSSSELGVPPQAVFFIFNIRSQYTRKQYLDQLQIALHYQKQKVQSLSDRNVCIFVKEHSIFAMCTKKSNSNCGFERCICLLKYYECEADPSKRIERR